MIAEPILVVLMYSALAAAAAGLGVIPHIHPRTISRSAVGWANALASGLMFGVAYVLLNLGLQDRLLAGAAGALLGILFVRATHALTGTGELDRHSAPDGDSGYGYKVLLTGTLHAAHEGIAIGVAMSLSLPLGIAMAATLGVHNVPEALSLSRVLLDRGLSLGQATGLAVVSNLNQVLLAVATFAVLAAVPAAVPWVTGFAAGAFTYLVLVELLPQSYRQAGHTSIALVTLIAMGMVVLLAGVAG